MLLSCFNESFNHFIKSGDGATGVSSALGGGAAFAGGTGERAVEVLPDPLGGAATDPEEEGVIGRRPTEGATIAAAVVFPLEPTVVHAPPVDRVAEVAYAQDIQSDRLIHQLGSTAQTLFVVSAYARRAAADATDSLEAVFFLLSSSSRMSLKDFLVAGFCALVQTAGGVDWAGTVDETVVDMEDVEVMMPPPASLDGDFAPT